MRYFHFSLLLAIIHTNLVITNISAPTMIELHPKLINVKANVTIPVTLPAPDTLTSVVSL